MNEGKKLKKGKKEKKQLGGEQRSTTDVGRSLRYHESNAKAKKLA
jgi:hypothetical protein